MTILQPTGSYRQRIAEANASGCELYLEQHFNSGGGSYSLAKFLRDGPPSRSLAMEYARTVADRCPVITAGFHAWEMFDGPWSSPDTRRGLGNLRGIECPAALLEPGFVDVPAFAEWAKGPGVEVLAGVIVDIVVKARVQIVALSAGHGEGTANPGGAAIYGGGWEHDLAARVVGRATEMLG